MHLSPSSISTWARLGAATADDAASHAEEAVRPGCSGGGGGGGADSGLPASAKLAEACLAAAEKHAMFCLLSKARDAGSSGVGGSGSATSGKVGAKELAGSLSGIAKATMCGGVGGGEGGGGGKKKSKSDVGVGASTRSVRATSRAVHLYPGDTLAWRCLATALVSTFTARVCIGVQPWRCWSVLINCFTAVVLAAATYVCRLGACRLIGVFFCWRLAR